MQIRPLPWTLRQVVVLLSASCCISCSRSASLNPAHGQVFYKNQPVAGALLTFHPQGADFKTTLPVASTDDEGKFTVMTGQDEGAPAGAYVVTIIAPRDVASKQKKMSMGSKPESVDQFKGAYAKESTSSIRVEIKKGNNDVEPINLK